MKRKKKKKAAWNQREAGEVQFFVGVHPVCPFPESCCSVDIIQSSPPSPSDCWLPAGLIRPPSARLVSVTGTGGIFWGTGAEGASRSPAAGPDPTPCGQHVDTGPSEAEAQLRRGRNTKVREGYLGLNTESRLTTRFIPALHERGAGETHAHSFYLQFCLHRFTGYVFQSCSSYLQRY